MTKNIINDLTTATDGLQNLNTNANTTVTKYTST